MSTIDGEVVRVELRVFIDKSVVEIFVNGKHCVALRVVSECEDSVGVSFRAQGQDVQLGWLAAWQADIYE